MKSLLLLLLSSIALADTLPPGAVQIRDASNVKATITNVSGKNGLDVNVISSGGSNTVNQGTGGSSPWLVTGTGGTFPVTGTFFQSVQPVSQSGTWTVLQGGAPWSVSQSGAWTVGATQSGTWTVQQGTPPWSVSVSSSPANQSVNLNQIVGAAPSATNALPARITNGTSFVDPTQIRALTSSDVVTAQQGGSWAVTANAGTGTFQTNVTNASIPVTQSGAWTTGRTWSLLNTTDSVNVGNFPATFGVTQSTSPWVVSGTVTANAGTNLNTSLLALDSTLTGGTQKTQINNGANTAQVKAASTSAVATDPALVVAVSPNNSVAVTGTFFQATQPVSGTVTANAGTGNFTVVQPTGTNLHVVVDSAPTTTVTGTVTANAGTNLNTSALQLDTTGAKLNNAQGSTTSGQTGPLIQGAVTTGSPTYSTAQTSPLSLTTAGALRTDASATTQPVSGTVTANAGTGTFTVSGTVTANAGTNLNTSALATSANQTTLGSQTTKVNDGTNTMAVKAASTAPVATDPAAVVALSPNGNQAKDSSVTGLQVAQGSTTSGQNGDLIQGAVTTNSPSYSTAQTSPLSLNLRGGLRANIVGGDASQIIRNDYSSTNVTTATYVQLVASTANNINRLWIFDSSGQDLVLATGAAASEVDQIQIPPGGWDSPVDIFIASGTRLSVKSKSATASSGILLITGIK